MQMISWTWFPRKLWMPVGLLLRKSTPFLPHGLGKQNYSWISKTHWMYLCTQQRKNCIWEASLALEHYRRVDASKCERVLGLTFEGNLSMRKIVCLGDSNILKRATDKMKAVWKIRQCFSFKARKPTVSSLILSKLFYGGSIWITSAPKSELRTERGSG